MIFTLFCQQKQKGCSAHVATLLISSVLRVTSEATVAVNVKGRTGVTIRPRVHRSRSPQFNRKQEEKQE